MSIQLILNGEPVKFDEPMTVLDLLKLLKYEGQYFAVALNRCFVLRGAYGETQLKSGDEVEILSPMQGG